MLEGHVEVFAEVVVAGDRFQQAAGDAIGVGIKEAQPAQAFNACQSIEQCG